MNIVGLFKGETTFGKKIRSGGAAVVRDLGTSDQQIIAVAEERVSRQKYAGGFAASLPAVLQAAGLQHDEIDAVAVSTCCEPQVNAAEGLDLGFAPTTIIPIGHHDSHATLSFLGSGAESALVVILDGGGDVLREGSNTGTWWQEPREQQSYYLANRSTGLELIDRDFADPYETGFGELYRALTYFLGWPGSRFASKVMALSAYGDPPTTWPALFETSGDHLRSPVINNPPDPIGMIRALAAEIAIDVGEPRSADGEILQVHKDLATYLQRELERALVAKVKGLLNMIGSEVDCVCLGGGVALNVLANGVLATSLDLPVYVPSAPGDDGQALGNALATCWANGHPAVGEARRSRDALLGPERKMDSAAVSSALHASDRTSYAVFEYTDPVPVVAHCLASGSAVCVFQERGEHGPRALGARSILADPTRVDGRAYFNSLKQRDWFMPFAPALLVRNESASDVSKALSHAVPASPFMSFAIQLPEADTASAEVHSVLSDDGTARVQTVEAEDGTYLARVLEQFEHLTGVPMVLNTSFNSGGEPIVETVEGAIDTFSRLQVNLLALGRFVIAKSLSPELVAAGVMPDRFELEGFIVRDGHTLPLALHNLSSRECIRTVQAATETVVFVRSELPLYGPYLEWLREGRKVTTIRYRRNAVELPSFSQLPLFETEDFGVGDRSNPTAVVSIERMRYQIFGELTEDDARRDGFESLEHMRTDLSKIYSALTDSDWVTIYDIGLVEDYAGSVR